MSDARVLLLTLSERTSAKGTRYLSGWCGKARLVGFLSDEPDKFGNPQWLVYAAEPEPRPEPRPADTTAKASAPTERREPLPVQRYVRKPIARREPAVAGELVEDSLSDLYR
jgi:hypothetical protein